jgi:hypothetical protein
MADAANDGYFVPEQIWDRSDIACYPAARPTGSAAPLNWAEVQYLRLAQSIDAGYNLDTPSIVKAKYHGAGPILGVAASLAEGGGGAPTAEANAGSHMDWAVGSPSTTLYAPGAHINAAAVAAAASWMCTQLQTPCPAPIIGTLCWRTCSAMSPSRPYQVPGP